MPDYEAAPRGPVRLRKIERVHQHTSGPIHGDKAREPHRCSITAKQFLMQHQGEDSEGDDGQHRKPSLHPKQLSVEGYELGQVALPVELYGHLEAGDENHEMAGASRPESEVEKLVCE